MPVGGYYIDASGLDELARELEATAGGVKDLRKVYRQIGNKAAQYVKFNEPVYGGPDKGRQETIHLQDRTRGGGGKTAWVSVSNVPYIYVQEFGGTSYWYRGPAGLLRALNKSHRSMVGTKVNGTGHVIYKKPRRPKGYFIWNVAWKLRSFIGQQLTDGIAEISRKHGLAMDVRDSSLDIEQKPWDGGRS